VEGVADVPFGVVTLTLTVAGLPTCGLTAVIVVEFTTVGTTASAPKSTAVAPVKPVPVMVTTVPPASGPDEGLRPETVGP
jgi:hypothetical protein